MTLHIEGRDLPDMIEKAVSLDRETCRWRILGEAAEVQQSAERSRVLKVLADAPEGLSTTNIRKEAYLRGGNAADQLLHRMHTDGLIERIKRGVYGLPGTRANLTSKKDCQEVMSEPKALKIQQDAT